MGGFVPTLTYYSAVFYIIEDVSSVSVSVLQRIFASNKFESGLLEIREKVLPPLDG